MMINLRFIHLKEDSFAHADQYSGESTQLFWSFAAKQNLSLLEKKKKEEWPVMGRKGEKRMEFSQ